MSAHAIARSALARWPGLPGSGLQLINHSENHTFAVDAPGGKRFALRLHRPGYQSHATIESELAWLAAIRRDILLPVPEPVPGLDGTMLQTLEGPEGGAACVLFRHIAGSEPVMSDGLGDLFGTLGDYAAALHGHVETWRPPAGFVRQVWSANAVLDADGLWGDWRKAPGLDAEYGPVVARLDTELRRQLAAYGTGRDRFGLIHADMRLGNLLVEGDHVSLIDFDDCGFCWFTYDFAASISFHETHAAVPDLKQAWIDRYTRRRTLSRYDLASIDAMVMLRRMALLAWIGSHAETPLAQTHAPGFAEGTAILADRFLRGRLFA
jgi:Ser/Thr protein kinase RdoA (MazF antagonist)